MELLSIEINHDNDIDRCIAIVDKYLQVKYF